VSKSGLTCTNKHIQVALDFLEEFRKILAHGVANTKKGIAVAQILPE